MNRIILSSARHDWRTPAYIIDRVEAMFGEIGLDPSNSLDGTGALRHFTPGQDSLSQPWIATTLYMNPPYGRDVCNWIQQLVAECKAVHIGHAILLLRVVTDTGWMQLLLDLRSRRDLFQDGSLPRPSGNSLRCTLQ